jgi:hypothetical protein
VVAVAVLEMEQLITERQQVVAVLRQHRLVLTELQEPQTLAVAAVAVHITTLQLGL